MIAYHYPPHGGIGVLRALHFSRYLLEFGWNTSVISVSNDPNYLHDRSLLKLIPKGQTVVRAYRLPLFETISKFAKDGLRKYPLAYSFLDPYFDWVPAATRAALRLADRKEFDAVLATAPPFSAIRVANAVKKKQKTPLIADLRDPFTLNVLSWPSFLHKQFYTAYWRKLLKSVDRALVIADFVKEHLEENLGLRHLDPAVIPNGYDPEDFVESSKRLTNDRFTLGYTGSFWGPQSPEPLFQSLKIVFKLRPDMKDNLRVAFMGAMDEISIRRLARKYEINDILELLGYRHHSEAISFMQQCHVLLLFTGMVYTSPSGKIFEYIATENPVLSFGVIDYVKNFIEKNKFGYSVNGLIPEEGANKIIEMYDKWTSGQAFFLPSPKIYEQFSRRNLSKELAIILDSLV
jgi:glycosyltransferase involved in cell wall biosynthesis